jgi:hypothetical protein
VVAGTGLLVALYFATPKETKDKIRDSFKRGSDK